MSTENCEKKNSSNIPIFPSGRQHRVHWQAKLAVSMSHMSSPHENKAETQTLVAIAGEAANNRLRTSCVSLELSEQFTSGETTEPTGKSKTPTQTKPVTV